MSWCAVRLCIMVGCVLYISSVHYYQLPVRQCEWNERIKRRNASMCIQYIIIDGSLRSLFGRTAHAKRLATICEKLQHKRMQSLSMSLWALQTSVVWMVETCVFCVYSAIATATTFIESIFPKKNKMKKKIITKTDKHIDRYGNLRVNATIMLAIVWRIALFHYLLNTTSVHSVLIVFSNNISIGRQ